MIRVLVVDDDARVARDHHKLIETTDEFEAVGVAHTARNALALVEELRPDLVLLDIYLPDESGVTVLRQLRGAAHTLDVLVITAMRDVDTVQAAMQTGAVHYLLKPFPLSELRMRDVLSTGTAGPVSTGSAPAATGRRETERPVRSPSSTERGERVGD